MRVSNRVAELQTLTEVGCCGLELAASKRELREVRKARGNSIAICERTMTRECFLDQLDPALLVAPFEEVVAEIPFGNGRAANVSACLRELEGFEVDRL